MKTEIFLDASYAIALSVETDLHHDSAVNLAIELKTTKPKLVTTRAIILEIGNALSKERFRNAALLLIDALENDDNIEIVPLNSSFFEKAMRLFRSRPDKNWGLTDCFSFVVMQERGITEALTTDVHFKQAGFRRLLIDEK